MGRFDPSHLAAFPVEGMRLSTRPDTSEVSSHASRSLIPLSRTSDRPRDGFGNTVTDPGPLGLSDTAKTPLAW